MKLTAALVWKEWRENQAMLWIGLGVLLGFPVIGGLEGLLQYSHRFEISTGIWVYALGGILALLVGVGIACRDYRSSLEIFWRSRPVGIWRWMLVKYIAGLVIVLLACSMPLIVEILVDRHTSAKYLVFWLAFLWAAIYSVSFFAGILLRRMVPAAIVALAALLLMYYLPAILPPLASLNFVQHVDYAMQQSYLHSQTTRFVAAMLGISAFFLLAGLVSAWRGWHIKSSAKLIFAALSLAIVIFAASAAYQLGTNLPILQTIDLSGEKVVWLQFDGNTGYGGFTRNLNSSRAEGQYVRQITVTPKGISLGPRIPQIPAGDLAAMERWSAHAPTNSDIVYAMEFGDKSTSLDVVVNGQTKRTFASMADARGLVLYAWHQRLYFAGQRLLVWDITDPTNPIKISDSKFNYGSPISKKTFGSEFASIQLPPIPGLPAPQRLEMALKRMWGLVSSRTNTKDIVVMLSGGGLAEYRLTALNDTVASYHLRSKYHESLLEKVLARDNFFTVASFQSLNGRLYVTHYSGAGYSNPYVTVFRLHPLAVVGHFAAPGVYVCYPLPDGRAIVAGSKIWLVGPPPGWKPNEPLVK